MPIKIGVFSGIGCPFVFGDQPFLAIGGLAVCRLNSQHRFAVSQTLLDLVLLLVDVAAAEECVDVLRFV